MLPEYRVLWVLAVHDATQPAHRLTVREVMQAGRWGAARALHVTDCNGNGSGLQSTEIWDRIICVYLSLQDRILCN